jgi:hypothetical protein
MKVFFSYGHDRNMPIVSRIRKDLEDAGHSVWIDSSQIKFGDDWRRSIIEGLQNTDWTIGFLSAHSIRNPGVCLDELSIALHLSGGAIATILLESEGTVAPPVSISQTQWLDMHEWAAKQTDGEQAFEQWYQEKLKGILTLLESPASARFAGEIRELEKALKPASQGSEIGALIDGFIGRDWLKEALETWRRDAHESRLFWITGAPGTGKSAFAAWLAHFGKVNVIGVNLCRYNIDDRRDPGRVLRTLAFQIATRLPDYRRFLIDILHRDKPTEDDLKNKSTVDLFHWLLAEPLRLAIGGDRIRDRYLIVIDALDETIQEDRSRLAETLAESAAHLPSWIAFVVTSRPEPAILRQFDGLRPHEISAESQENQADLRTYIRHWLAVESVGGGSSMLERNASWRQPREISSMRAR